MIDFVRLQKLMKEQLEMDRQIRTVNTDGDSLESALAKAGILLDMPVRRIEYEIVERGSRGIFGSGKKDWKIRAYTKNSYQTTRTGHSSVSETETFDSAVTVDKDGEVFVILSPEGAMLKVTAPVGSGNRVTEAMAMQRLTARNVKTIDENLVRAVVEAAEGKYVAVGTFNRNYSNDSPLKLEVLDFEMKAYIIVQPPGPGGCDLTPDAIINHLRNNRVVAGIKNDAINAFVDNPVYKTQVLVAEGIREVNGRNAYIEYLFETNQNKVHLRESRDGTIDFKDLQIIQNVVENQPVAKKIPAQEGVKGRTVRGTYLPAKDGIDIPLPLGKNVHASEDGMTIIADINGQVLLVGSLVNVEPVFVVQGNVSLKTGNIIFLGTVEVTGNVEDGFSVKAAGNISVNGTVGNAELEAEGDIIVRQGITGKSKGSVKAGKSIWARFIENAVIDAGNMVIVSDGIINSQVDAYKRIVCQGKRARIVGGRLRASEEINAHVIGSSGGGTETICEAGIDPKIKKAVEELTAEKEEKEKELETVTIELQGLINIKAQRKSLPEEKEFLLNELMDQRNRLNEELQQITDGIAEQQKAQDNLKTRGRISAANVIYPGTKILILDVLENIRSEYKSVTFVMEDGLIRAVKYEQPDEEATRGPEGYND
ncbi:MAG: FapA family protein [Treponema sp.]|jgi:uncharacterized protein (DUF342 family)|nr:FapA family protein [Treponema sp.]